MPPRRAVLMTPDLASTHTYISLIAYAIGTVIMCAVGMVAYDAGMCVSDGYTDTSDAGRLVNKFCDLPEGATDGRRSSPDCVKAYDTLAANRLRVFAHCLSRHVSDHFKECDETDKMCIYRQQQRDDDRRSHAKMYMFMLLLIVLATAYIVYRVMGVANRSRIVVRDYRRAIKSSGTLLGGHSAGLVVEEDVHDDDCVYVSGGVRRVGE